jgi:peptidoglycan/xylan/chitin deacetylase (PgdA/CDA1 family)
MIPIHQRFPYSGISQRPSFSWPGGKKLALYVALNVEHFPFGAPTGIDLDRETKPWSQRSWLWREYGNRVGGWRMADLFDHYEMNLGVIVNAANYSHCPELVARFRDRGDELIGHGISNGTQRPIDMDEQTERDMIRQVTEIMTQADGVRPTGWLSPYLTPSDKTPDLLAQAGYEYLLDWGLCDEQPVWMNTDHGKILSVPYPIELNDQPAIVGRRLTASGYADTIIDQFDELMRVSRDQPVVFPISLHTFVMGQPYRMAQLRRALDHIMARRDEIWVTRPVDVARYYRSLPKAVQLNAED